MTISAQSRYSRGTVVRLPDSSGTYNLSVLRTVPPVTTGFSLYTWQSGDRPDLVANRVFGNPLLWWAIFDANPEIINPLNVPPGTIIRMPIGPVMGQGTLLQ